MNIETMAVLEEAIKTEKLLQKHNLEKIGFSDHSPVGRRRAILIFILTLRTTESKI